MFLSELIPTKRAVVDVNRVCNARCQMCYYTYEDKRWTKPLAAIKKELILAKRRGNTSVDFTGGEPTIHPEMTEIIRFSESIGLHTCIITNGLATEKIKRIVEAGCREWLLSIHGYKEMQDKLFGVKGAWDKMQNTIEFLKSQRCFIRVNCTLTKYNYKDLPALAAYYVNYVNARIVNFINFNPHYQWGQVEQPEVFSKLNEVQIRVSEVAPYLKEALNILEVNNLWANVRYFPFCVIKGYEAHICNNPQVMFDPYEWDYNVYPKTEERYLAHGREFQRQINSCEDKCGQCGILNVCGGINRNYAKLHGYSELEPYDIKIEHPYHFKKDLEADIVIPSFKPSRNLQYLLMELAEKSIPPYNIILISKHQSAAMNRNYGLERSKSPYIIMCDDDICDLPYGWNRTLINVLKENREIMAVSARLMNPDGTPGRNTSNNYDLDSRLVPVDFIPTACCIFRKTALRFDERYIRAGWEDTDFFMQMKHALKGQIVICNDVKVVHLNEEKNTGGTQNTYNQMLFQEKWFKKKTSIEEIGELINKGQLEKAISLLKNELEKDQKNPELINLLGIIYMKMDRVDDAIECFYASAKMNPQNVDYLKNLIESSQLKGKYEYLVAYLKDMIIQNPDIPEYPYLLSECLTWQGRYDEALEQLEENEKRFPDHLETRALKTKLQNHDSNTDKLENTGQTNFMS